MERMTWIGYLRSNKNQPDVRTLLFIGGDSPRIMEDKIASLLKRTKDEEAYRFAMNALERWRSVFRDTRPGVLSTPLSEWRDLGQGCHQRKTHIGGNG